jgi:hypothetical protein
MGKITYEWEDGKLVEYIDGVRQPFKHQKAESQMEREFQGGKELEKKEKKNPEGLKIYKVFNGQLVLHKIGERLATPEEVAEEAKELDKLKRELRKQQKSGLRWLPKFKSEPPDPYSARGRAEHHIQRLVLTEAAHRKIFAYCEAAPGEVSGFAKTQFPAQELEEQPYEYWYEEQKFVHYPPKLPILITDVMLFKQKCSRGGTHLDKEALARAYVELARRGENMADWNCWWHTHCDFDAYFSGIDTATIAELSAASTVVGLCINKMGDMTARLDTNGELVRWLKPVVLPDYKTEISKQCAAEVALKVKEKKYAVVKTRGHYQHGKNQGFRPNRHWRRRDREFRNADPGQDGSWAD